MLRDALIFVGGLVWGWASLAGLIWFLIWQDDRKRKDEDC